jgi:hypothetical protein
VDAIWAKAEEVAKAGHYGGNVERAYSALKRGQDRGGVQEEATKLEIELRKSGQPDDVVKKQVGAFLQGRGVAPPEMVAALRSGVNPKTGKAFTESDYRQWDAAFPSMPAEDVLGSSPVPSREQMEIMRRDAEANGIKNPEFAWEAGGRTTKGSVPGGGKAGLPERMVEKETRAPRQITTLIAPRTAAEVRGQRAPEPQRLSDNELFVRAMGIQLPR